MATRLAQGLNVLPSLRRHPWRVAAVLLILLAAAGAGVYALIFYHHLHAAEEAAARYDFDAAHDHLAQCIRLWPRRGDLHLLAARNLRRAGRLTEAAQRLDESERLDGKTPAYLLEYAMLRVQQGDLREPRKYLLRLLDEDHPEATLILEALAYGTYHVYLLGVARNYAERALERDPGNVPMMLLLAAMHDSRARFEEAEAAYRAAVRAQPDRNQARLGLAQFLLRHGKVEEATDHFEYLRGKGYQTQAVLMGLALCCRNRGEWSDERTLLDTLLAESPDNVQALVERGRLELDAEDLDAAERDLRRAAEQEPFDRQAHLLLGQCLSRRGKQEESAACLAKLAKYEADMKTLHTLTEEIAKQPNDPEKHRQAGLICQRYGLDREAERWLLGALQIDPRYPPTYESLADFYTHVGRLDLAAQYREGPR
jgi:predicted Zn-dependent protease